jgi:hypothetical protein
MSDLWEDEGFGGAGAAGDDDGAEALESELEDEFDDPGGLDDDDEDEDWDEGGED